MKTPIGVTAIFLSLALILCAFGGCSAKSDETGASVFFDKEITITLTPYTADVMQNIFMYNPDRGFRTDFLIKIHELVPLVDNQKELTEEIASKFDIYFGKLKEPCHLAFAYIYLTEWHDKELSDDALRCISAVFNYCRTKKYKLMVNFCYNENFAIPYEGGPEYQQKLASECADEATILKHIDQLSPVVSEYKDCIYDFTTGFIGYVGEWAPSYQYPLVSYETVTKAIVEKLCVPNGLYFSTRVPEYKTDIMEKDPSWPYYDYISYSNCAMYGEQTKPDWHSACLQVNHNGTGAETGCTRLKHEANTMWEYMCEKGGYTPQGGEMYTANAMNRQGTIPSGREMILELAHHWHSTFSFWHGKYDTPTSDPNVINIMEEWDKEEITEAWLKEEGIIYDPNWFLDDEGNTVERTCYEFIRDHLGYKLVADKATVKADGEKITVDISFKNYGFAAAFNLMSGFAVLDENYEVVSEVMVGDPSKWYSHDPDNWKSTEVLEYSLSGELEIPSAEGEYSIAFFLRNSAGIGAQLSNDVEFENEYNILYNFTV